MAAPSDLRMGPTSLLRNTRRAGCPEMSTRETYARPSASAPNAFATVTASRPISRENRRRVLLATLVSPLALWAGEALADDASGPPEPDGLPNPGAGKLAEAFAARLGERALRDLDTFDNNPEPIPIAHGWFHPLFAPNVGYAVVDEPSGPAFASAYSRFGGRAVLGNPAARPALTADGWTTQTFERGALGWRPGDEQVTVLPAGEFIRQSGIDPYLAEIGLPSAVPLALTAAEALHRLAWLTDPVIRDRYYRRATGGSSEGEPIDTDTSGPLLMELLGLPASPLLITGQWRRQRFERGAMEYELAHDGTTPAEPALARVGIVLRLGGALPDDAIAPDRLVGNQLVVRGPVPSVGWRLIPGGASPGFGPLVTSTPLPSQPIATVTQSQATPTLTPVVPANEGAGVAPPAEPTVTRVARPTAPPLTAGTRATGASIQIEQVAAIGGIEQVVVVNRGTASQDLSGWGLRSATSTTRHPLPAGLVIDPGTSITFLSGASVPSDPGPRRVVLGRRSFWPDSGGVVVVLDRDGLEVHRRTYP